MLPKNLSELFKPKVSFYCIHYKKFVIYLTFFKHFPPDFVIGTTKIKFSYNKIWNIYFIDVYLCYRLVKKRRQVETIHIYNQWEG